MPSPRRVRIPNIGNRRIGPPPARLPVAVTSSMPVRQASAAKVEANKALALPEHPETRGMSQAEAAAHLRRKRKKKAAGG